MIERPVDGHYEVWPHRQVSRRNAMNTEVEWARLTGPEIRAIAARPDALAMLPIGSLEQHGPHLPVITDTASANAAAIRAARLVVDELPVLVLPGLWTGMSEHHRDWVCAPVGGQRPWWER
jgi:hypothetical protein